MSEKFKFDPDAMFKACALYLSKGLVLIRVHGIWPDGRCTCGKADHYIGGPGERSCGKHPVAPDWGKKGATSEDDILDWLEDGVPFNVGVLLGPKSGVTDEENDTREGQAYREAIGMHLLDTPTFASGKSIHQITAWDDRLAACKGSTTINGLEVRMGAGGAAAQSILPPSWHYSGVQYRWLDGKSIDEVDPAPMPKALMVALVNAAGDPVPQKDGGTSSPLIYRTVHDGEGRHRALLIWTWQKIVTHRNPEGRRQRDVITREIADDNEKYISPPKTGKEVLAIVNSCFDHYRRKRESGWKATESYCDDDAAIVTDATSVSTKDKTGGTVSVSGYESHGLKKIMVGSCEAYEPDQWHIEMIHSDPPEIVLCVPAWENTPCRGRIPMSFETFLSAGKVAAAVFLATRKVMLNGDSAKWTKIWKGQDASKKNDWQSIPGLAERLMSKKTAEDDVYVGTSSLRYAQLAGFVLQVFKKATQPRDEEKPEPNESGRPCWVTPDKLWFQWGKIWEDIGRTHDVAPGERTRIRGRLIDIVGQQDFVHERHRFAAGRLEFVVFDSAWIGALEKLADGDEQHSDNSLDTRETAPEN